MLSLFCFSIQMQNNLQGKYSVLFQVIFFIHVTVFLQAGRADNKFIIYYLDNSGTAPLGKNNYYYFN